VGLFQGGIIRRSGFGRITVKNGMNYEGRVLIRPKGGTLSASGDKISVKRWER